MFASDGKALKIPKTTNKIAIKLEKEANRDFIYIYILYISISIYMHTVYYIKTLFSANLKRQNLLRSSVI